MNEMPPLDHDDLAKELYAFFGLAMYQASVMESGLANVLVLAKMVEGGIRGADQFDLSMAKNHKNPLGQLVKRVKPYLRSDESLAADLDAAVPVRNDLAHHFWRENIERAVLPAGQLALINDLFSRVQMFVGLSARLSRQVDLLGVTVGVTRASIDAAHDELLARIMAAEDAEAGGEDAHAHHSLDQ